MWNGSKYLGQLENKPFLHLVAYVDEPMLELGPAKNEESKIHHLSLSCARTGIWAAAQRQKKWGMSPGWAKSIFPGLILATEEIIQCDNRWTAFMSKIHPQTGAPGTKCWMSQLRVFSKPLGWNQRLQRLQHQLPYRLQNLRKKSLKPSI